MKKILSLVFLAGIGTAQVPQFIRQPLFWFGDDAGKGTFTFELDVSATATVIIQEVVPVNPRTFTLTATPTAIPYGTNTTYHFRADLPGNSGLTLQANMNYTFLVHAISTPGGLHAFSPTFNFSGPPSIALGAKQKIVIWADSQEGGRPNGPFETLIWPRMMAWRPNLVLGAGDYNHNDICSPCGSRNISDNIYCCGLRYFFRTVANNPSYWPYRPNIIIARGNHEYEDALVSKHFFPLPIELNIQGNPLVGSEYWTAKTWNNIRFLIIDTNENNVCELARRACPTFQEPCTGCSLVYSGKFLISGINPPVQAQYFQAEVQSTAWKRADFRIVMFHHAHRTEQWDSGTCPQYNEIRNLVENTLLPAGANFIITGHSHTYCRGDYPSSAQPGATHIVIGGGGGAFDNTHCNDFNGPSYFTRFNMARPAGTSQVYCYAEADYTPGAMVVRIRRGNDNSIMDQFQINGAPIP